MTSRDESIRDAIAEQAAEWLVANDEASLGTEDAAALVAWFRASPVHVEEFLGVAGVARDLRACGTDPDCSVDALVERARAEGSSPVRSLVSRTITDTGDQPLRRWRFAYPAVAVALVAAATLGLWQWSMRPSLQISAGAQAAALHFATRHGEQRSVRLSDNTILHLNTDSAVTVRYSDTQRLVVLDSGEAAFDVSHEAQRAFRVNAGPAVVVDLGTSFNVRLAADSTVVTVLDGHVSVAPSPEQHAVLLGANQQIRMTEDQWPVAPIAVDGQRVTAWLHRQILFDHEPLERVAAEINRYAPKPIAIVEPSLRNLEVSGVFSTDDSEEFLAFLRSLEGVRVEVTATEIRVSRQ
jgi:transmembrane sensor